MHLGILGGYPTDFARLQAPRGIQLHYIERDTRVLRVPKGVDAVLVVTRFVSHRHWQQLREQDIRVIPIEGGWTMVRRALRVLADESPVTNKGLTA